MRIGKVELSLTFWSIDFQFVLKGVTHAKPLSKAYAHNAIVHVGSMEAILAIAFEYFPDMGKAVEIVFHTLDFHHGLSSVVCGEGHVFHYFRCHFHLLEATDGL